MTTAELANGWGANSEYGALHDVLLCRPEYFHWLPTSSISKATLKSGAKFDRQLAMKQHDEVVQAYEDAGATCHFLETEETLPYQVYARDSSFMTPYGAVVTQMAQWWRRGEYAPVIRFYQGKGIPIYNMITAASFEGRRLRRHRARLRADRLLRRSAPRSPPPSKPRPGSRPRAGRCVWRRSPSITCTST